MSDGLPSMSDLVMRGFEENQRTFERRVQDIESFLQEYKNGGIIYAYDGGGNPTGYEALCRQGGGWNPIVTLKQFQVVDTSSGSTLQISLVPSTISDATNSGFKWSPTGSPLALSGSETESYLDSTIDPTTGLITASAFGAAATMPTSTSTHWYLPLSSITCHAGTPASVTVANNGWYGPLEYYFCGSLPLLDGTKFRWFSGGN